MGKLGRAGADKEEKIGGYRHSAFKLNAILISESLRVCAMI